MKRFGEKAVREVIANGAIIRAWDWYTLEAGYRVIIDEETAGYIVSDLFFKLKNDGTIKKDHWAYSYTDYKAAEEIAAPEYLNERWPESNEKPGIYYSIDFGEDKPGIYRSAADFRTAVQQAKHNGRRIAAAWRHDDNTPTIRRIIPETSPEKTDRENREHCKRIADELEAYAAGNVYKCPECGQEHAREDIEESEHEDESGWAAYTCPSCGAEIAENDWEQMSLYDYFSDCLDIEYRCGSDRAYRSVCIMVACGGPNIYIDTDEKAVLLYWWTNRARYYLSSDAVEAVDDWAREYWECL